MHSDDPLSAQQIVAEYARVLERHLATNSLPAPIDALPFAKPTIKTAIKTSVQALASTGQLTDQIRDFLQTAYVSLADYLAADLVRLMAEFQRAGDELAADGRLAGEKTNGAAWRTIAETGRLAGDIARSIATEAEHLRTEFERFMV